ncbi:hypothetical protein MHLP_00870 [Candidatus Mycoplasma haematolamae str. Purdue]|uniref:Uncharacterized protein n=1 Tax=Mycoplasma haematolamae (strain Purdue) TaxID=1212765 RepID=I7CIQ3_MYCHA|nr:hypothetical protein [Candidatus Mycoplasma haematolamae]AFO51754.1 hypothetical protein MHLP_00870 [Candidatus Mycoplasma haematolamae str. Purdue]
MLLRAIALKVGVPFLAVGSVGGGSYYVVDAYVLKSQDLKAEESTAKGFEYQVTLKGQGKNQTLSLICLDENLQESDKKQHNLQLLMTGDDVAEITCVSGKDPQVAKLTLQAKKEGQKSENTELEVVEQDPNKPITKLECNAYDDAPHKSFDCHLNSQKLTFEKGESKLIFRISQLS